MVTPTARVRIESEPGIPDWARRNNARIEDGVQQANLLRLNGVGQRVFHFAPDGEEAVIPNINNVGGFTQARMRFQTTASGGAGTPSMWFMRKTGRWDAQDMPAGPQKKNSEYMFRLMHSADTPNGFGPIVIGADQSGSPLTLTYTAKAYNNGAGFAKGVGYAIRILAPSGSGSILAPAVDPTTGLCVITATPPAGARSAAAIRAFLLASGATWFAAEGTDPASLAATVLFTVAGADSIDLTADGPPPTLPMPGAVAAQSFPQATVAFNPQVTGPITNKFGKYECIVGGSQTQSSKASLSVNGVLTLTSTQGGPRGNLQTVVINPPAAAGPGVPGVLVSRGTGSKQWEIRLTVTPATGAAKASDIARLINGDNQASTYFTASGSSADMSGFLAGASPNPFTANLSGGDSADGKVVSMQLVTATDGSDATNAEGLDVDATGQFQAIGISLNSAGYYPCYCAVIAKGDDANSGGQFYNAFMSKAGKLADWQFDYPAVFGWGPNGTLTVTARSDAARNFTVALAPPGAAGVTQVGDAITVTPGVGATSAAAIAAQLTAAFSPGVLTAAASGTGATLFDASGPGALGLWGPADASPVPARGICVARAIRGRIVWAQTDGSNAFSAFNGAALNHLGQLTQGLDLPDDGNKPDEPARTFAHRHVAADRVITDRVERMDVLTGGSTVYALEAWGWQNSNDQSRRYLSGLELRTLSRAAGPPAVQSGRIALRTAVAGAAGDRFRIDSGLYAVTPVAGVDTPVPGGDKGAGTINAAALYQAGVAVQPLINATSGFTADTGASRKGSVAAYTSPGASTSYSQADTNALMQAAQDTARKLRAIEAALFTAGIITA